MNKCLFKMFHMKKIIFKIFIILCLFAWFWLIQVNWVWIWKVENSWWYWWYKEKLEDLKNVFDENWNVSASKILNNRKEISTMLQKRQLVWWEFLDDLLQAIAINWIFEVNWDDIFSLSITWNIPLFEKVDSDWNKHKYLSVDSEKLYWVIFAWKEDVWKRNIFDMLRISQELENKWWLLPWFYQEWQQWYAYVWKSFTYSINKLWSLVESEELWQNVIPVETDNSLLFVWLVSAEKWVWNYSQYATTDDQFAADNPFIVWWKIQIDSFLFNYCQKEFFDWDYNATLDMFVRNEYENCHLLENDFDNDWINELILTNEDYRVSNIYYQDVSWSWKLIIWPIYKSDRQIIKLLQNSNNVYSSFILKDWIDTNSYKNILQNQSEITLVWWAESQFKKLDLTYSYDTLETEANAYAYKDVYSSDWNWYSNYKIDWFYTISKPKNDDANAEWWLLVRNKDWWIWWIILNEKYVWIANQPFLNQSPTDYILIPRNEIWVNFKESFIELEYWTKAWWKTLTLKIDWKTKLIVQEWAADKIIYSDADVHPVVQLTDNETTTLLNQFSNVTWAWLISHYSWSDWKKNSIYDLKFLVPEMSNIYLLWIKNDNNSSWFQLKQILSLWWYDYNFVAINDVNDKSSKNIVLKNWLNFDDNILNNTWLNQYVFHNETIDTKKTYAWVDLYLRSVKYFSKDALYLEQIKNIYFTYDKSSEMYVLDDRSTEEINIKWIKLWDYNFLDWCSYEEIINNDLSTCWKNITPIDVDNDKWNEWLYNNQDEIQIFNNIIKINSNWTYSINFVPIFKDTWLTFCNTFEQNIPYYHDNAWTCWETWAWNCLTNYWLIFYDSIWTFKTFVIKWDDKDKKTYSLIDSSLWLPFICVI